MRTFRLVRTEDVSGVSGTGVVAEGCQFTSGKVALNWRSEVPSTGIYDDIDDVRLVHGHGGTTVVEWLTPDEAANCQTPGESARIEWDGEPA